MYFKILAEDLTHHGYTYHEGLNIDSKPFNLEPKCDGGLFFADGNHILEFCNHGIRIAEVVIPEREEIVKVKNKYKAHRIILNQFHYLWTPGTFKWLSECGVDLHVKNGYALRYAAEHGYIEVVKYLIEHGADVSVIDEEFLFWIIKLEYENIAKYLIEHGASTDINRDLL